eukprot:251063-Rhodomonas_salina.2
MKFRTTARRSTSGDSTSSLCLHPRSPALLLLSPLGPTQFLPVRRCRCYLRSAQKSTSAGTCLNCKSALSLLQRSCRAAWALAYCKGNLQAYR